jgi:hypothetical protein
MIFQRYRRKIISYDLNSGRYINTTHILIVIATTGMCAYTVIITPEVLLSVLGETYKLFVSTVALSILGATQSKLGDADYAEGERHRDDTVAKELVTIQLPRNNMKMSPVKTVLHRLQRQ